MWLVVLSETGRVPVDNPVTPLALPMVHAGLVLDVSGRHLALLEWAGAAATAALMRESCVLPAPIASVNALRMSAGSPSAESARGRLEAMQPNEVEASRA